MTSNPLNYEVVIGGSTYTIDDIPVASVPVWELLKKDGKRISAKEFDALPGGDKATLFGRLTRHLVTLNMG